MTKFKPTDKVKYGDEELIVKVSRKDFSTQRIFYRFEDKGNMEVEEKYLKKVALTAKEKKAEKAKAKKAKDVKLIQERILFLMPYKDLLQEGEPSIDLDNISDEARVSLLELTQDSFEEMVETFREKLDNPEQLEEVDDEEVDDEDNDDIPQLPPPEKENEAKGKMSRKSKKGKK